MKRTMLAMVTAGIAAVGAQAADAQVPGTVTFTARVVDDGTPVTGTHAFTFRLFDAASGGTQRWSENYGGVLVQDGLVTVALGSQTTLTASVLDGTPLFVEVALDGSTLSPRLPLRSIPYAVRAGDAATVGGQAATAFAAAAHNHDAAYVNVAGDSMSGSLNVNGNFTLTGFGNMVGGGRFNGVAVGSAPFGALTYPYESIQLDPGFNLRFNFGSSERMLLANDGRLWMTGSNNGDCPNGWFCNGMFWDMSVASILYSGLAQRSDARLKQEIRTVEHGLETLMALRPVTFRWRDPKLAGRHHGFIAQEVGAVLPDLVSTGDNGMLALDSQEIVPIVVQAVKELKADNDRLRAELEAMRSDRTAVKTSAPPARSWFSSAGASGIGLGILLFAVGLLLFRRRRV